VSRLRRAAALLAAPMVLLAACGSGPGTSGGLGQPGLTVDVDVDTPQLRAIKKEAGVEPCRPGKATEPATGGLPELTLDCLGGGADVDLSTLTGPLVINLWAQWCGPCREELPYFQRLHEEAGDKVQVLGIDYQDTQPEAALELIDEVGVTYPLVADPAGQIRVPFKVRGLPGVVLVDRVGRVTHTEYVVIDSYDQLRDLVREHLGVRV